MENYPNELFRAVHNASEISDYLIENYQEFQAEQQYDMQQKQISEIQSEELSNSGNAKLRVAIKRAVKADSIEAGVKYLEKSELRHPDDVKGHRLVKEKFLENIKVIHGICEQLGDRVSVLSSYSVRPREYEGRRYGSERLQKILARTWEAMDKICPVQRASAPDSFVLE